MAFIGNTNITQSFTPAIDYFSGNGSSTAFTLSRPVASVAQVQVTIDNVVQNPSTAFSVSNNTITFTSAPLSGTNNIYVYYTSPITQVIAPSQGTVSATSFASSTGTGAVVLQTSPTITTPIITTPTISSLTSASATNLTLQSAGTTAITIDTSQNVGIGTTSPSTLGKLAVIGGAVVSNGGGTVDPEFRLSGASAGVTRNYAMGTDSGQRLYWYDYTAAAYRMLIDSSGNVGINTTSPSVRFQVSDGAASSNATMKIHNVANANTNFGCAIQFSNQDPTYYMGQIATLRTNSAANYSSYMTFSYSANTTITEGMRLTSDGELWVARTTDAGAYNIQCGGTGVWGAGAYVNGSDARIKDNIEPISSSLEVVSKLNPVTYKYKEDWSKDRSIQTGFIAQELLEALEGQNYVDGVVQQGGVDGYYSVAYQNIIPILTKAIQEQQTIINDLKARIETLEGK